jgi:membrane protein
MLGGERLTLWIGEQLGFGPMATRIWLVIQYPIALALLVALAFLIYYFLPFVKQRVSHVLVGSLVATVLWVVATLLFRAYVINFGSYNKTYGTIGGVIILLSWMYYSMVVLLIGGELNAELHHGTAAIKSVPGTLYANRVATGGEPAAPSTMRIERVTAADPLPLRRSKRHRRAAS